MGESGTLTRNGDISYFNNIYNDLFTFSNQVKKNLKLTKITIDKDSIWSQVFNNHQKSLDDIRHLYVKQMNDKNLVIPEENDSSSSIDLLLRANNKNKTEIPKLKKNTNSSSSHKVHSKKRNTEDSKSKSTSNKKKKFKEKIKKVADSANEMGSPKSIEEDVDDDDKDLPPNKPNFKLFSKKNASDSEKSSKSPKKRKIPHFMNENLELSPKRNLRQRKIEELFPNTNKFKIRSSFDENDRTMKPPENNPKIATTDEESHIRLMKFVNAFNSNLLSDDSKETDHSHNLSHGILDYLQPPAEHSQPAQNIINNYQPDILSQKEDEDEANEEIEEGGRRESYRIIRDSPESPDPVPEQPFSFPKENIVEQHAYQSPQSNSVLSRLSPAIVDFNKTSFTTKAKSNDDYPKNTQTSPCSLISALETSGVVSTPANSKSLLSRLYHSTDSKNDTPSVDPLTPAPPPPVPHPREVSAVASRKQSFVLLGSGLKKAMLEQLLVCVHQLGGKMVKEWSNEVTHLIVITNEEQRTARTFKYLMALIKGIWIINYNWILNCISKTKWVDEEKYEAFGDFNSSSLNSPKRARLSHTNLKPIFLFQSHQFYLPQDKYTVPSPSRTELEQLIISGQGIILTQPPKPPQTISELYNTTIHIIVDDLYPLELSEKLLLQTGRHPISYNWVLDSISCFTIQDVHLYHVKVNDPYFRDIATQNSLVF